MKLEHIRLLQRTHKASICIGILSFLVLGIQSLLLPPTIVGFVFGGALTSFFIVVVSTGVLAHTACPSCKKPFIGCTEEDGTPTASFFCTNCMYCGFPEQNGADRVQ